MAWRDDGTIPADQIIDVRFADFMADPWATIGGIYDRLEEYNRGAFPDAPLPRRHPGDGGGKRYTWADTGLDAAEVRERVSAYQERYDVPTRSLE